jgi:opacity protein-like surface antigen
MRARHFLLAALLVAVTAAATFAADVTGTWTAEFDTQIGVQKYVFVFKADGEKLTGTADAERMGQKQAQVPLEAGSVKGDQISFIEKLSFDGNALTVTYTGTIAGDEIKFSRSVGDFATETFVARRKKD